MAEMKVGALVAVIAVLAGVTAWPAAASPSPGVVTSREWLAAVNDWLDNMRIDHVHSCGAVVEAVAQLSAQAHSNAPRPSIAYPQAIATFDRYAVTVCPRTGRLDKITLGMTDGKVAAVAGMPRTPRLNCWLYPATSTSDGRRVCFTRGRVSLLQLSKHL
jgi:hypothetical protein